MDVQTLDRKRSSALVEQLEAWWLSRLGAWAGIVGSLVAMVGNLLHPATPIGDPEGVARAIADSGIWVADHLAIVLGLVLMLGGLSPSPARSAAACRGRWPGWDRSRRSRE